MPDWLPTRWRIHVAEALQSRWETAGWLLLVALLLAGCPLAVYRTVHDITSDFPEFHEAGRAALLSGVRDSHGIFRYYLPSLDAFWAILGAQPLGVAALAWYVLQVAAWLALLAAIGSALRADWPRRTRRQAVLASALLVVPLVVNHLCLGAFHILMAYWLFAGLWQVARGRWRSGGLLVGLAVWIKLLPALAVVYLLWKQQWKPALVAIATVLVVDVGLSLAAYGPAQSIALHRQWWQGHARGAPARIRHSQEPSFELSSRNQGLAAILRRTLTDVQTLEGDTTIRSYSLAKWPAGQVQLLYFAWQGGLLLALAWHFRQPASAMSSSDWLAEIALVCLATLWFSPLVWSYHYISALPALAYIIARTDLRRASVWGIVLLWAASLILNGERQVRAYGGMYAMSLVLGAAVIWAARIRLAPFDLAQNTTDQPLAPGRSLSIMNAREAA